MTVRLPFGFEAEPWQFRGRVRCPTDGGVEKLYRRRVDGADMSTERKRLLGRAAGILGILISLLIILLGITGW